MSDNLKHIVISRFVDSRDYQSKVSPRTAKLPKLARFEHGNELKKQYQDSLKLYDLKVPFNPITEQLGVYIEITSRENLPLALDKLDNQTFHLCAVKQLDKREQATIFIPEDKRNVFVKKIDSYLDINKDSKPDKKTNQVYPANHDLLARIDQIKLADLRSFWTDDISRFPLDDKEEIWWELWLKVDATHNAHLVAQKLCELINAQLANSALDFFNLHVVLIKTSAHRLAQAPELIANLAELRIGKENPAPILTAKPLEQQLWAQSFVARIQYPERINTSVVVVDTGVNYHHPILTRVIAPEYAVSWDISWPHYDSVGYSINPHGSIQAGIAAFGDLMDVILSSQPILQTHIIESARILPPYGYNDPQLYGAITIGTINKLTSSRPHLQRVYSLAVTSSSFCTGQPSSWSSAIDGFCFAFGQVDTRLFIISAGNNHELSCYDCYWDVAQKACIENPAQSWNAITVGAFTEKTTNDEAIYEDWAPMAAFGDINPATRTSVEWGWVKHAPFKPDIVAEGGNRLISLELQQITNTDGVSLLSTSGSAAGQLFESALDTSAACALVSRYAAILMHENPDYWPETIRGLLIHSARWTDRMNARFSYLQTSSNFTDKDIKKYMLRMVGFGVPSLLRAQYSARHELTLIAQDHMQPFKVNLDTKDPKMSKFNVHQLPWPVKELKKLNPQLQIKLRVTLSYFIEPNPSRRGDRTRYNYQSHGLRFKVIRPTQSYENFLALVNKLDETHEYKGAEGDLDGWFYGDQLRTRGSVHHDVWEGTAQELADMHTIAVYPVSGWWKYKTASKRAQHSIRYCLLVSIETPNQSVDIYTPIVNQIKIMVQT